MIASGITDTVLSGPFVLAALLSLAAGVVSFASPCVVPLVPGYLSYLAGLVGAETSSATADLASAGAVNAKTKRKVSRPAVLATALFVAGFSVIFILQSVAVFGLTQIFLVNPDLLAKIGGGVTIVMGLVLLGFVGPLQREWRLHLRPKGRIVGAPLLGLAFGLGWVACLGPVLIGVLALAQSTDWNGNAWRGLFLVLFYCLGLGLPFLLLAFGFSWASTGLKFLRRNSRRIQIFGGAMMIALGVLMVTGVWTEFINWLQAWYGNVTTVL